MTGSVRCLGWKDPEAPISAVNPSTVEFGSNLPLRTDSSKLPNKLFEVKVAGADADSNFLDGRLCLLLGVEVIFEMGNFSQTASIGKGKIKSISGY